MGKELRNENIARNVVVKGCASKDAREYATAGLPTCFSNLQIDVHEFSELYQISTLHTSQNCFELLRYSFQNMKPDPAGYLRASRRMWNPCW